MDKATIPHYTPEGLPRLATAKQLCDAIGIADRRCLDKWGVKRTRMSRRCVRYDVADFYRKVDQRTTTPATEPKVKPVELERLANLTLVAVQEKKRRKALRMIGELRKAIKAL